MRTFCIQFVTIDGNINEVYIDARNEQHAEMVFSENYMYDEIILIF